MAYQSKPKRNRRPLNFRQAFGPPLTPLVFSEVPDPGLIVLGLAGRGLWADPLPMRGPLADVEWPMTSADGLTVILSDSATLSEDGLSIALAYTGLTTGVWWLSIPAFDPAFRNNQGGWLAPASFRIDYSE